MDYIETISVERMKKVIEWEQGWISKCMMARMMRVCLYWNNARKWKFYKKK